MNFPAYFLWVGSALPEIARISVRSAAEAGFDTVLFTDRPQKIDHARLRLVDWREVGVPWSPEQVRLVGASKPYFAGFADLFRYYLLSKYDGWWFDCDTVVLKKASEFNLLMEQGRVNLGYEDCTVVNNAVIGSVAKPEMRRLYEMALPQYPIFDTWGMTGPRLVTRLVNSNTGAAFKIMPTVCFYPVHHKVIDKVYLPECADELKEGESEWYCLSLWGEVLSRSGLKFLAPPRESYLGDLLARNPALGTISSNPAALAEYLGQNVRRLDALDSGSVALRTLLDKIKRRIFRRQA